MDEEFDVQANCLQLTRKVEMLQWVETVTVHNSGKDNERKDYTYTKEWREELVSHKTFLVPQKKNLREMPMKPF